MTRIAFVKLIHAHYKKRTVKTVFAEVPCRPVVQTLTVAPPGTQVPAGPRARPARAEPLPGRVSLGGPHTGSWPPPPSESASWSRALPPRHPGPCPPPPSSTLTLMASQMARPHLDDLDDLPGVRSADHPQPPSCAREPDVGLLGDSLLPAADVTNGAHE